MNKILSSVYLFLILILVSCRSYNDVLIEFKEDGSVVETPVYREVPHKQDGSGLGITPHMRLGPRGGGSVIRPDPASIHNPPAPNEGSVGVPIDLPPDDPGGDPTPNEWNCKITFINQTSTEIAKYNAVCAMLEDIVPSLAFKNEILNHRSCNGNVGYYGVSSELGNVGPALYQHIIDGDETRPTQTAIDNELDIKIEMYRDNNSNTIGYTYASSDQIWVNRKYSDGYKPSSLGSNMFHEWLHKMGYGHSSAYTSCRPYSIPYAGGYIVRDFMQSMQGAYGY